MKIYLIGLLKQKQPFFDNVCFLNEGIPRVQLVYENLRSCEVRKRLSSSKRCSIIMTMTTSNVKLFPLPSLSPVLFPAPQSSPLAPLKERATFSSVQPLPKPKRKDLIQQHLQSPRVPVRMKRPAHPAAQHSSKPKALGEEKSLGCGEEGKLLGATPVD